MGTSTFHTKQLTSTFREYFREIRFLPWSSPCAWLPSQTCSAQEPGSSPVTKWEPWHTRSLRMTSRSSWNRGQLWQPLLPERRSWRATLEWSSAWRSALWPTWKAGMWRERWPLHISTGAVRELEPDRPYIDLGVHQIFRASHGVSKAKLKAEYFSRIKEYSALHQEKARAHNTWAVSNSDTTFLRVHGLGQT